MGRGIGKATFCDGCGCTLTDYHGRMVDNREAICDSIVFGAYKFQLCTSCSQHELDEEVKHGTNDLPHLLEQYKQTKR